MGFARLPFRTLAPLFLLSLRGQSIRCRKKLQKIACRTPCFRKTTRKPDGDLADSASDDHRDVRRLVRDVCSIEPWIVTNPTSKHDDQSRAGRCEQAYLSRKCGFRGQKLSDAVATCEKVEKIRGQWQPSPTPRDRCKVTKESHDMFEIAGDVGLAVHPTVLGSAEKKSTTSSSDMRRRTPLRSAATAEWR